MVKASTARISEPPRESRARGRGGGEWEEWLLEGGEDAKAQMRLRDAVNGILNRIHRDQDAIILITGEPGRGKSTLALELATLFSGILGTPFGLDDVHWTGAGYMRRAWELLEDDATKGHPLIHDEGYSGIFSRDFSRKENKAFQKWLGMIRWANLIHLICAPRLENLDENLRSDRLTHWILLESAGKAILHEKRDMNYSRKVWFQPVAQFRFPELNPHDHALYREYLNKKDRKGRQIFQQYLNEVEAGSKSRAVKAKAKPGRPGFKLPLEYVHKLREAGRSYRDIADELGCSAPKVSQDYQAWLEERES